MLTVVGRLPGKLEADGGVEFRVQGSPPSAEFLHEVAMKVQVLPIEAARRKNKHHHQPIPLTTYTTNMAMKRKLNSDDVPEVVAPEAGETQATTPAKATFDSLNLDSRILQAITREKFTEPTPVQAATLPLALSGRTSLVCLVQLGSVAYKS
jgi:hypothetical protein